MQEKSSQLPGRVWHWAHENPECFPLLMGNEGSCHPPASAPHETGVWQRAQSSGIRVAAWGGSAAAS